MSYVFSCLSTTTFQVIFFRHLEIALAVDEQVLWLEVPVDEVQVVQVLERKDNLRCVEPGVGLTVRSIRRKEEKSM